MNFKDAVEALKSGKKLKRRIWLNDTHLIILNDNIKSFMREAVPFTYDIDIINSNNWVVHGDQDEKEIHFADAIQQLLQNKSVRLKPWDKTTYIKLQPDHQDLYLSRIISFNYIPPCRDFISNDWEIIE